MKNKETWATSIQFLMQTFRSTLAALCPFMEKVQIRWRFEEAYDDWDEIAQCLFNNIVLRTIRFSGRGLEDLTLPDYGTVYDSYSGKSFIEVIDNTIKTRLVFVGFSTLTVPFDQVMCQEISIVDYKKTGPIIHLPFEDGKFTLILQKNNQVRSLTDFVVDL